MTMKTLMFQRLMTTYLSRRSIPETLEQFRAMEPFEQKGVLEVFDQQMDLYNALYEALKAEPTEEQDVVG